MLKIWPRGEGGGERKGQARVLKSMDLNGKKS